MNKVKRLSFAMTTVGRMKYTNILVLISKKNSPKCKYLMKELKKCS